MSALAGLADARRIAASFADGSVKGYDEAKGKWLVFAASTGGAPAAALETRGLVQRTLKGVPVVG